MTGLDPVDPAIRDEVVSGDALASPVRHAPAPSFEAFYRREVASLVALARALVVQRDLADDVVQEAMLAAYQNWSRIAEYDNPAAWVRRVCANKAVSEYRRLRYEAGARLRLGTRPTAVVEAPTGEDPIWAHVRNLPRRQAQSLALLYVADLIIAEIAECLGCSVGAVKVHLSRARRTLSQVVSDEREDLR